MNLKTLVGLGLIALVAAFVPVADAQTFSVIHAFHAGPFEGGTPWAGVTIKGNVLYGTTREGGLYCFQGYSCGTVYQLKHVGSDWIESVIYRFPPPPGGRFPQSRVVFGPDGHLYGTTSQGGSGDGGEVFELLPPASPYCPTASCLWTREVLHSFPSQDGDGASPGDGDLIWDPQGNIYGITSGGGNHWGTVFQMTKSGNNWTEAPIYKFNFAPDGYQPENGVVIDNAGNLFGTTFFGGTTGGTYGTVFEVQNVPEVGWQEALLYSFQNNGDGVQPMAGLVRDSSGNLYGATRIAYPNMGPAVFELSPSGNSWTFKVLYQFPPTGEGPWASLTLDAAGNLYGTTIAGGASQKGNVFKLTNTVNGWVYTSLHDFTGGDDGDTPLGNVSIDTDGTLYGTASHAANANGVVWMIKP